MRFRTLLGAALLSGAMLLGGSARADAGWYYHYCGPRVAVVAGGPYYAHSYYYHRYHPYGWGYYGPRAVVVRPYTRPFVGIYYRR